MSVADPYNCSLIVPLAEWIEHPLVQEHVHDGQTLQVGSCSKIGVMSPDSWNQAYANDMISIETIGSAGGGHDSSLAPRAYTLLFYTLD